MKFTLEQLTGPGIEPVSLAEMKRHLREFSSVTELDSDIEGLITGARQWVEEFTGRALIDQTWRLNIGDDNAIDLTGWQSEWPAKEGSLYGAWSPTSDGILLRRSPVIAIVSVAEVDSAGAETEIDDAYYQLRESKSKWPRLVGLSGWTWASGILRIVYRAGYADRLGSPTQNADVVPQTFKTAMKLWVEAMYDRDKEMMPLLMTTAENVVRQERSHLQIA